MKKSLKTFITDSVTRISSFINSSFGEDWHDMEESDDDNRETVLFDESISFSRDIIEVDKESGNENGQYRNYKEDAKDVNRTIEKNLIEGNRNLWDYGFRDSGGVVEKEKTEDGKLTELNGEKVREITAGEKTRNQSEGLIDAGMNNKGLIKNRNEGRITLAYSDYEILENRILFLENELRKEGIRNTNHLVTALKEKEEKIKGLMTQLSTLQTGEQKMKNYLITLEKDLVRANDKTTAFKVIADEKIDSVLKENESLRDQLEFERSKNERMRERNRKLGEEKRVVVRRGVEIVEYIKIILDNNLV